MRREYQRENRFPVRLGISVSPALAQALEAAADKAGWSLSRTARECIEAGLRTVRPRLRPSKRPQARPEAGNGGGE